MEDATNNHLKACIKHQKGTGEWFTKSEQYSKWVSTADSVLWINGIRTCCLLPIYPSRSVCLQLTNPQPGVGRLSYGKHTLKRVFIFSTEAAPQPLKTCSEIINRADREMLLHITTSISRPRQNSSSSTCYDLSLCSFVANVPTYRFQSTD